MTNKKPLTLIEVVIAISLFLITASALGWKMQGMVQRKRFRSDVARLEARLLTCRQLAVNMQADWKVEMVRKKKGWRLTAYCLDDLQTPPLSPLSFGDFHLSLNGERQTNFVFDFTRSGDIHPRGCMQIDFEKDASPNNLKNREFDGRLGMQVKWELGSLFSLQEKEKASALRPKGGS